MITGNGASVDAAGPEGQSVRTDASGLHAVLDPVDRLLRALGVTARARLAGIWIPVLGARRGVGLVSIPVARVLLRAVT